jgi:hypothetical protein
VARRHFTMPVTTDYWVSVLTCDARNSARLTHQYGEPVFAFSCFLVGATVIRIDDGSYTPYS